MYKLFGVWQQYLNELFLDQCGFSSAVECLKELEIRFRMDTIDEAAGIVDETVKLFA